MTEAPRRRMPSIATAIVASVVLAVVAAVAVAFPSGTPAQGRLEAEGRRAAAAGTPSVDLGVLGNGDWQRVGVFSDYGSRENVETTLKVRWPRGGGIFRARDYVFHLVFARGDKVVSTATVDGLVACLLDPGVYPRTTRFAARVVEDDVVQLNNVGGGC